MSGAWSLKLVLPPPAWPPIVDAHGRIPSRSSSYERPRRGRHRYVDRQLDLVPAFDSLPRSGCRRLFHRRVDQHSRRRAVEHRSRHEVSDGPASAQSTQCAPRTPPGGVRSSALRTGASMSMSLQQPSSGPARPGSVRDLADAEPLRSPRRFRDESFYCVATLSPVSLIPSCGSGRMAA